MRFAAGAAGGPSCVGKGRAGVPESGNEKARKGRKSGKGDQSMDLGNLKRSRPAPMLTGEGMPGLPGLKGTRRMRSHPDNRIGSTHQEVSSK
jgi:hypothetical protein